MVSLLKLAEITEEGVKFQSPHDGSEMMLTPEKSMEIQNIIGSDIMMQLDDVVSTTLSGPRVEEAMHRSIRWLDRWLVPLPFLSCSLRCSCCWSCCCCCCCCFGFCHIVDLKGCVQLTSSFFLSSFLF